MRSSERSLARRVGWTAAGAACAAGLATLLVAMAVVDHLERAEARDDALSLAEAIAREIREGGTADRADLEEEVREFTHSGASIAVVGPGGDRLAGVNQLPSPHGSETCEVNRSAGTEWFVCAAAAGGGRRVLVGETTDALLSHRAPLLFGGMVALLVVLLGSVLAGLLVGRWSLAPLVRLEQSVARVEAAQPEAHAPFERSGLREVDAISRSLEDLLERLSEELARSRRFSADAAHELRTPLTKLRAELELVAEELPSSSPPHEALLRTVSRTDDLTNLVERLLLLASPEDAVRSETLTSLAVVLETAVEELSTREQDRMVVTLDGDGLVMGDEAVLRSALSNAIGNALKYSRGEVRVSVAEDGDAVVVRVDDDGPGLGAEGRERAFEPFYRSPRQRASPGHGVGLALIAHVVRAHRGQVRFLDDEPGAKLELRFPRHRG